MIDNRARLETRERRLPRERESSRRGDRKKGGKRKKEQRERERERRDWRFLVGPDARPLVADNRDAGKGIIPLSHPLLGPPAEGNN
jgi:hypothetical protein